MAYYLARPTKRPTFLDDERRACAGEDVDWEWFFAWGSSADQAKAKAVCGQCPFQVRCRDYAVEHEGWGVWGGATVEERLRIRCERQTMAPRPRAD
jgi:WhiB family redox-sensing transcriptional regulator